MTYYCSSVHAADFLRQCWNRHLLSVCPSVESELTVTIFSLEILHYSENRF